MTQDFQLELTKGQQIHSESDALLGKLSELNAWLENLPSANIGTSTQLFYEKIRQLNSAVIPAEDRFDILEHLRTTHQYLKEGLSKKYLNSRLPLSEKNRQIAEINRELIEQMAIGYKIIAQDHASGKANVSSKLMASALGRALFYLSSSLLESYLIYSPVLEMTWYETHSIFRYAHLFNLKDRSLTDELLPNHHTTNIEQLYTRILITAAIDPYRFPRGESSAIYNEMGNWVQHARLQPERPEDHEVGYYMIKLNSDHPPIHLSSSLAQADSLSIYLDCTVLANEIREKVSHPDQNSFLPWRKNKEEINYDALNNLLIALGANPERVLRRTPTSAQVNVVIGLKNIHQMLLKEFSPEEANKTTPKSSLFQAHDIPNISDKTNKKRDVWSFSPEASRPQNDDLLFIDYPEHLKKPEVVAVEKLNFRIIDISSGGYCLGADKGITNKLQVGDLMAIRETSHVNFSWKLGSIQWIRQQKEGYMNIGVKVIHASALPVFVQIKKDDGCYSTPENGILLPAFPALNQNTSLITNPTPFRSGLYLQVRNQQQISKLMLTRQVSATSFYAQHEFNELDKITLNPKTEKFDESKIKAILSTL